jgi:hypothetical protein
MAAETARKTDPLKVISFKHRVSRRRLLEAISHERGHRNLAVTAREAIDEYIERYLRQAATDVAA